MNENFIPDIGEIVKLAYDNSFASKKTKRNEADMGFSVLARIFRQFVVYTYSAPPKIRITIIK